MGVTVQRSINRGARSRSFPGRVAPAMIFAIVAALAIAGCKSGGFSTWNPGEDARKMQGTWRLTGAAENGEQTSGNATLTIDRDQYTMSANGVDEVSTFTLGTGGPRTIRVFHHENPLAAQGFYGGTLTGIYELSGNHLRICFDGTGRSYPRSFDASQGSHRIIFEFVRE